VIAEFDENSIPSKPRSGVKLCTTILEASKDENSIPNDSTFSDYSDRLLASGDGWLDGLNPEELGCIMVGAAGQKKSGRKQ
jgi:hypothetical protein